MIIEICILKVKKYIYVFIIKFKSVWFFMCYLENVEWKGLIYVLFLDG